MSKRILLLACSAPVLLFTVVAAQRAGRAAAPAGVPEDIRLQSGCFQVSYRFLEPGRKADEPTTTKEWITLDAPRADGPVSLTHIGIFDDSPTWHFKDVWTRRPGGAWKLEVFGRRGPRFSCESKFEGNRLHCKAPNAGKPLRDRDRTDYDKLHRGISLFIQPKFWAMQEYNDKVKDDGKLVNVEVGLVEYQRLDDKDCEVARKNPPKDLTPPSAPR
jgi:hypothetical protein